MCLLRDVEKDLDIDPSQTIGSMTYKAFICQVH